MVYRRKEARLFFTLKNGIRKCGTSFLGLLFLNIINLELLFETLIHGLHQLEIVQVLPFVVKYGTGVLENLKAVVILGFH